MTDICDRLYGKKLTRRVLKNMSVSKLQFVVNDLHSQIESKSFKIYQEGINKILETNSCLAVLRFVMLLFNLFCCSSGISVKTTCE